MAEPVGVALFALASASALADPGRHHWRHSWQDDNLEQSQDHRRRPGGKATVDIRRDDYFADQRGRYFGVGPGSYECYGYDCNW